MILIKEYKIWKVAGGFPQTVSESKLLIFTKKSYSLSQPYFEGLWGWNSHSQNWDLGNPPRLPKFQSSIVEVKTLRIEVFFISLES
jgi:hypothetical protein